jgi:hypothetical protein
MSATKKILLVEGENDKGFFIEICKKLNLNATVRVAPPKELGGKKNSKEGVIRFLEQELLPNLPDGNITHIAAVVDADYVAHRGGYTNTLDRLSGVLAPFGFSLETGQAEKNGLRFTSVDGFADFGLWIMPDNQNEGMLEDWIKSCVKESEQVLFQQAVTVVERIPEPKFSESSRSKAEVATWLAWQKKPGHGLYYVMKDGFLQKDDLLEVDHPLFKELEQWLINVFADLTES